MIDSPASVTRLAAALTVALWSAPLAAQGAPVRTEPAPGALSVSAALGITGAQQTSDGFGSPGGVVDGSLRIAVTDRLALRVRAAGYFFIQEGVDAQVGGPDGSCAPSAASCAATPDAVLSIGLSGVVRPTPSSRFYALASAGWYRGRSTGGDADRLGLGGGVGMRIGSATSRFAIEAAYERMTRELSGASAFVPVMLRVGF